MEPPQPQETSGHGPVLSTSPVSAIRHILGDGLICWCSWQSHRVVTILPASPTGSSGRGCLKYGLVKVIPRRSLAAAQIYVDLTLKVQRQDTTVRVSQSLRTGQCLLAPHLSNFKLHKPAAGATIAGVAPPRSKQDY